MAYRIGTALDSSDFMNQLEDFLTTANEYQNILVTGTGDGILESYSAVDAAPTEDWVLTCTTDGPSATFTVEGALSGVQADATSAVAYDNAIVAFTITDGTTAWLIGDVITFDMVSNMGTTTPYTLMHKQTTARKFSKSSDGIEFIPYAFDAHAIVDGKFPGSRAIHNQGNTLQNADPAITLEQITESGFDNELSTYSISFWTKNSTNTKYASPFQMYSGSGNGSVYTSPYFDKTTKGGTITVVGNTGISLLLGAKPDNTTYSNLLVEEERIEDEMFSSQWILTTVVVTPIDYSLYVNDSFIGTYDLYPGVTSSAICKLLGFGYDYDDSRGNFVAGVDYFDTNLSKSRSISGDLFDFCVWSKDLNITEVTDLFNSTSEVDPLNADLHWKLEITEEITKEFTIHNDSSRGFANIMRIGYADEHPRFTAPRVNPSLFVEPFANPGMHSNSLDTSGIDLGHRGVGGDLVYGYSTYIDEYLSRDARRMYGALRGTDKAIEKYWFIANEDRVIIAYKIHDTGATTQKDPVYQVLYSGLLTQTGQNVQNLGVFGTSNVPRDWQEDNPEFTIGLQDEIAGRVFTGTQMWAGFDADIGGTTESTIRAINGAHYIWPINLYRAYSSADIPYDNLGYATSTLYQNTFGDSQFGSPEGVYKVSPFNVIAEDIITVGADNFIVLSNVAATAEGDWFALQLK